MTHTMIVFVNKQFIIVFCLIGTEQDLDPKDKSNVTSQFDLTIITVLFVIVNVRLSLLGDGRRIHVFLAHVERRILFLFAEPTDVRDVPVVIRDGDENKEQVEQEHTGQKVEEPV